ncbi:MAG: toll/interleukin-1 receptor domain-containing protein [Pseudomonadota bacterium]
MRVFLSYRRADSEAAARSLEQRLLQMPDIKRVFLDHEAIPKGVDFSEAIQKAIRKSGIVLVLIGPDWRGEQADGTARILDENDFVRLEVSEALAGKRQVVPVLLNETQMPAASSLSPELVGLTRLNAARIRMEDFEEDVDDLLDVIFGSRHRISRWMVPRMTWFRAVRLTVYGLLTAAVVALLSAIVSNSLTGQDMTRLIMDVTGHDAEFSEPSRGYFFWLLHILFNIAIIGALSPFLYRNLKRLRRRN